MNDNDSNHLLIDIAQRLSNIEGQLGKLDSIDYAVESIRDKSNKAASKADSAYAYAKENDKDIRKLSGTIRWSVGLAVTILLPLVISVIGLIMQNMQ